MFHKRKMDDQASSDGYPHMIEFRITLRIRLCYATIQNSRDDLRHACDQAQHDRWILPRRHSKNLITPKIIFWHN
jgi:hypothetical protein